MAVNGFKLVRIIFTIKSTRIIIKGLIAISLIILGISIPVKGQSASRNVIDQLGRQVTLPYDPQRVVALAPSITEIIFALEQEHRLKGVTRFSDFPPEAAKLPKVGSYVHLDLERIVALKPDLCIAIKDGNPREVANLLESYNIPVYAVDPINWSGIIETVLEIGRLLNSEEKAKILAQNMRSRIQRVKSLVKKADYRPRVFFQIGISPIVSVGTGTFIHELIVLAGGRNLAVGAFQYPRFSREQVLELSPEVIIITSMVKTDAFERMKSEWNLWTNIPAVKNQRIHCLDSAIFNRPTPRLVNGLEQLARVIHPELFEGE